MSGATFARVKNWNPEVLTNTDLNAEIDNILNNLGPAGVGAYSDNAAMMRITTDPGEVGSESLATSLAGEIERLRFTIKEMKGSDAAQWYSSASTSLSDLLAATGGAIVTNRIVSGAKSTNSNASRFLIPGGTSASITLDANPTNLVYYINGNQCTATADTTFSSMNVAPSTNNTCIISDSTLAGQESSKWAGEDGTRIGITTIGTEISSLINKYAAFKVISGGLTEYFVGYVNSASITNCLRGCFIDQNLAAIPRIPISNNNTISVMGLAWEFINTTGGIGVSYVNPQISYATPSSTGGYWFDISTTAWKTNDGVNWVTANKTLAGFSVQDATACKGVRALNFYGNYSDYSNIMIDYISPTTIQSRNYGSKVSVGNAFMDFKMTKPVWDITTNRETGYGETASTTYFAYMGESGQTVFSPEKPYFSQDLGRNWYHPYENWRAIASIQNNAASDLDPNTVRNLSNDPASQVNFVAPDDMRNIGISANVTASTLIMTVNGADGNPLSPGNPGFISFRNVTATSGVQFMRRLTSNLNITVPTSATLGHRAGMNQYVWGYLLDNAGVIDIGVMGVNPFFDNTVQNYTAISSGATSGDLLYGVGSGTAKPVRLVGQLLVNEAGAGTWATTPASIVTKPALIPTITPPVAYSPTVVNFGTLNTAAIVSYRQGKDLVIQGYFIAGLPQNNTAVMALGYNGTSSNVTPDTNVLKTDNPQVCGFWACTNGSTAAGVNVVRTDGVLTFGLWRNVNPTSPTDGLSIGGSASVVCIGPQRIPIAGWSTFGP